MRRVGALLTTLLAIAAVLGTHLADAPAAAAEEPESFVRVELQRLEPALPRPDGRIALTAEVTNTSDGPLSNLQAYFWRSLDGIEDEEGMTSALASAANEPVGARKGDFVNLPSETDRVLDPGESTAFTVAVDVEDLELPSDDGIFLMGAQIRGRTSPDGPDVTLGRVRVFVPVIEEPPDTAELITTVVVLTSRPSLLREDLLVDDHLAEELASGGRLQALLSAADSPGTSFAVDPALIQALATMAHGYAVQGADGQGSTPGAGAADAARWLAGFDRIAAARDGYRLLYGSPDAAALVHDGQETVLTQAADAGRTVARTRSLPLLVLPAAGAADRRTVIALSALDPAAILLSDVSVRARGPLLEGPGIVPVVRFSSTAADGGPGPEPSETSVHLRQRFLADTWLEADEAEEGSTVGRVRLVTSAAQARSARPGVQAPWLQPSTLAELLRGKPTEWSQRYRYTQAARDKELGTGQLGDVARLAGSVQTYENLLVSPAADGLDGGAAVARTASSSFRRAVRKGRLFADAQQAAVQEVLSDGLTISVTRRVVTSARSGAFPVTVRNTLRVDPDNPDRNAIRPTRLDFTSANSQRLTVTDLDVERLAAGEGFAGTAQVEAKTNGTVRVTAQLLTAAGQRVGTPVSFDVRATQAGATGWLIAVVAGLVLVGATAIRIRAVARERSGAVAAEPTLGDPGPLSSAPPEDHPSGGAVGPSTSSGRGATSSGRGSTGSGHGATGSGHGAGPGERRDG